MFAWTTTSYPTYALHPLPYYPRPVPTVRERYLQAVADAHAARENYLLELEERRILAARDAWHRAAAVRRRGHPCAEYHGPSRPAVCFSPARRHASRGPPFFVQRPQRSLDDVDSALATLFGKQTGEEKAHETENIHIQKVVNDYFRELEAALKEAGFAAGPSSKSGFASRPDASASASHPSESVPAPSRNARDRAACTIQRRWRSQCAAAVARKDALTTITSLKARLRFLQDTFNFPEHLEFRERPAEQKEGGDGVPALSFVPANAAVHAFTHELTKLLTLADGVPSHGDERVREERRMFVRAVEEALDGVDSRVAKVWGKRVENSQAVGAGERSASSTVEPVPTTQAAPIDTQATDASADKAMSTIQEPEVVDQCVILPAENPAPVERHDGDDDGPVTGRDPDASLAPAPATASEDASVEAEEHDDDALVVEVPREGREGDVEVEERDDDALVVEVPHEGREGDAARLLLPVTDDLLETPRPDGDGNAGSASGGSAASDGAGAEAFDVVYPDSPDAAALELGELSSQRREGEGEVEAVAGAHTPASGGGGVTPGPEPEGRVDENDEYELL